MAIIRWKDCYCTGVPRFDEEHKVLVGLINGLYEAIRSDRDHVDLEGILDELLSYTESHFRNEEALMEEHAYPHLDEHRSAHEDLTLKVREMRSRMGEGEPDLPLALYALLRDWLLNHVVIKDKQYGEFFADRKIC